MEHRWIIQNVNGYDQLSRQQTTLGNIAPDGNSEVHSTIIVPSASPSFSEGIRQYVSLNGLYLIVATGSATKIMPLDGAPSLGLPENYEMRKDYCYEVTTANGRRAVCHIVMKDFIK